MTAKEVLQIAIYFHVDNDNAWCRQMFKDFDVNNMKQS